MNFRPQKMLIFIFLLFLAGCQSSQNALDVLELDLQESNEVYGEGEVLVGMVLPALASTNVNQPVQDYVDGAKVGLDLLGQKKLKLLIRRTDGSPASAVRATQSLTEAGVKIILGPSEADDLAQMDAATNIPIMAFVPNSAGELKGAHTFLSDPILAVNESIRATVEAGKTEFVLLHSKGTSSNDLARVKSKITGLKSKITNQVTYEVQASKTKKVLNDNKDLILQSEALIVLGTDAEVKNLLEIMHLNKIKPNGLMLIEVENSDKLDLSNPSYQGVIISKLILGKIAAVTNSFKTEHKRPFTKDAAYGFDMFATVAGLHRTQKLDSDLESGILDPKGFNGLFGNFRLTKGGKIERRMDIFQVVNGKLEVLQEIGEGF